MRLTMFLSIPDRGSPGQTEEDGAAAEIRQRESDGAKWRGQSVAWFIEASVALKWVHEQSRIKRWDQRRLPLTFDHICSVWNRCAWSFGYRSSYKRQMWLCGLIWSVWCIWTVQLTFKNLNIKMSIWYFR